MAENKLKCASCGANIKEEEKYCSYCGSLNPMYKEKKVEEVKMPENDNSPPNLDDMFGGFLGGVMLGGALRGMGRMFGRRPPRR